MKRWPYLLFALLLVGPALGLASLALRSAAREDDARRRTTELSATHDAERLLHAEAERLEALARREDARPYFAYQAVFMPEDVVSANGPAFVNSPLAETPPAGARGEGSGPPPDGVFGWAQWTLSRDVVVGPEGFRLGGAALDALRGEVGAALVARLRAAPSEPALREVAPRPVPVRNVAANEEVGQLLEELDVARRQSARTAYLDNFSDRVGEKDAAEATVGIRLTPFRWFVPARGDASVGSLPLLAWRLVWIPAHEAKAQRDAPADRWLLQAFLPALRLPRSLPWAEDRERAAGAIGVLEGPVPAEGVTTFSLADLLRAERAPGAGEGPRVVGVVNLARLADERRSESGRLRTILLALAGVVATGLFVLWRAVARELALVRRKEDFVAAVTHELKTPLAGIRMYADLLREGWIPDGGSTEEYAQRIVAETERLDGLVGRVLDLASLERGVAAVRRAPGDLGEAVRGAAALLEPAARAAQVPVAVEVEEGLPPIAFDPVLVRGIVVNLLDNAVKYSAGTPTRAVAVRLAREGSGVALVVTDRGPGIPDDAKRRLFEPFARGGREETRTTQGVGLGLALVKRYADALAARVSVESAAGAGTTVRVHFPA